MNNKKGLMPVKNKWSNVPGLENFMETSKPRRFKNWILADIELVDYKLCDDGYYEVLLKFPPLNHRYIYVIYIWDNNKDFWILAYGDSIEELKSDLRRKEDKRYDRH